MLVLNPVLYIYIYIKHGIHLWFLLTFYLILNQYYSSTIYGEIQLYHTTDKLYNPHCMYNFVFLNIILRKMASIYICIDLKIGSNETNENCVIFFIEWYCKDISKVTSKESTCPKNNDPVIENLTMNWTYFKRSPVL